ncbi:Os03g0626400 [Oryza sativa Japonica Group]|jgi:hypothetical protein|nr:hypothetical protein OsI_12690 [Oryza sativa Indica Group]EEE59532.1 hypothetical protein OsJ_11797 [Oryza sativa Japonica Group]KAB8092684.1 hypothetical protein EE612_019033 [Oryza sativa]BAS85346.1 Os03g0626400 [Oryza sativa Japonica Group]
MRGGAPQLERPSPEPEGQRWASWSLEVAAAAAHSQLLTSRLGPLIFREKNAE